MKEIIICQKMLLAAVVGMMAAMVRGQTTQAGGVPDEVQAAGAMMRAIQAEDMGAMKKLVYALPAEDVVGDVLENIAAKHAAVRAVEARFGEEGDRLITYPLAFNFDVNKAEAGARVEPRGTQRDVTMVTGHGTMVPTMTKKEGRWKWDLSAWTYVLKEYPDRLAALRRETAALRAWRKEIAAGSYATVDDAGAGLGVIEIEGHLPKPARNRWQTKADQAGLTRLQKAVYEEMAQFQDCELLQSGEPGWPQLESPRRGTPDATVRLLRVGVEAVPMLVEALDDMRETKTTPHRLNTTGPVWRVNMMTAELISRVCDRQFSIEVDGKEHELRDVVQHPEWAGEYQKAILAWYGSRKPTEAERKIADLSDGRLQNRLDAVRWLGRNKVVKAGPAIGAYMERTLPALAKGNVSLTETELAESAQALAAIGAKEELQQVEKVCDVLVKNWVSQHGPSGYYDLGNLYKLFGAEAGLGGKEAAVKGVAQIYEASRGHIDEKDSEALREWLKAEGWDEGTGH